MKPTSNFFSVLLTSSVIFASAWFFCSSTLMILSDFNFSADHTQFDVQKQTVQLNREKGTYCCFYQCGKHFMVFIQFYFCLLLVLWLFFFPSGFSSFYFMLALLERPLLFILSSARILALVFLLFLLIFVIFSFLLWAFLLTLFLFVLLLVLLFLLMFLIFPHLLLLLLLIVTFFCCCLHCFYLFPAVYLSCAVVSNVSTYVWLCCFYYFYLYFILFLLIVFFFFCKYMFY